MFLTPPLDVKELLLIFNSYTSLRKVFTASSNSVTRFSTDFWRKQNSSRPTQKEYHSHKGKNLPRLGQTETLYINVWLIHIIFFNYLLKIGIVCFQCNILNFQKKPRKMVEVHEQKYKAINICNFNNVVGAGKEYQNAWVSAVQTKN